MSFFLKDQRPTSKRCLGYLALLAEIVRETRESLPLGTDEAKQQPASRSTAALSWKGTTRFTRIYVFFLEQYGIHSFLVLLDYAGQITGCGGRTQLPRLVPGLKLFGLDTVLAIW